jgi:hypothetical protein
MYISTYPDGHPEEQVNMFLSCCQSEMGLEKEKELKIFSSSFFFSQILTGL